MGNLPGLGIDAFKMDLLEFKPRWMIQCCLNHTAWHLPVVQTPVLHCPAIYSTGLYQAARSILFFTMLFINEIPRLPPLSPITADICRLGSWWQIGASPLTASAASAFKWHPLLLLLLLYSYSIHLGLSMMGVGSPVLVCHAMRHT